MPMPPIPPALGDSAVAVVRQWIEEGALNN
jgi:hypothetical protein